jgi:uncharacterized protein YhbP (UPF0306 family)
MSLKTLDKDAETEQVKESIGEALSENKLLSMSTVNEEKPHINTAFYAFDNKFNLYILTPPETEHGENIDRNSLVAVDIHDSHQKWTDDKQGLQIFGKAKKAEKPSKALKLYKKRFSEMEEVASNTDELDQIDSVFYKIAPERIKIFDEPRFGTETWVNVRIE